LIIDSILRIHGSLSKEQLPEYAELVEKLSNEIRSMGFNSSMSLTSGPPPPAPECSGNCYLPLTMGQIAKVFDIEAQGTLTRICYKLGIKCTEASDRRKRFITHEGFDKLTEHFKSLKLKEKQKVRSGPKETESSDSQNSALRYRCKSCKHEVDTEAKCTNHDCRETEIELIPTTRRHK